MRGGRPGPTAGGGLGGTGAPGRARMARFPRDRATAREGGSFDLRARGQDRAAPSRSQTPGQAWIPSSSIL